MPILLNRLETQQEIEQYQKWLKTKPLRTLYVLLNNFERDMQSENPRYVNHNLRIQLVQNEIMKRLK